MAIKLLDDIDSLLSRQIGEAFGEMALLIGDDVTVYVTGDSGTINIDMQIEKAGKNVGYMSRTYYADIRTLDLSTFFIDQSIQNQGLARKVHEKTLALAQSLGVKNYTIDANADVGGYAWLRAGMVPTKWSKVQNQLIDNGVTALKGLTAEEAGKYIQTNLPALKEQLLGTNWSGGLDLENTQQLNDYTNWTQGGTVGGTRVDPIQLASSHALTLNRYAGGVYHDLLPILDKMEKDILDSVAQGIFNEQDANKIVAGINAIQTGAWSEWNGRLGKNIEELALYENTAEFDIFNAILGPDFPLKATQTAPEAILSAVYNNPLVINSNGSMNLLEPFTKNWEQKTIDNVNSIVRGGLVTGQSRQELRKAIVRVTGESKDVARTLSRTALNHVSTQARDTMYRANDDIVQGYEIVATLDRRTTPICRDLDGEKIKFTDKRQLKPPFHPGCRTTTVPWLRDEFAMFEFGERASESGPVASDTTYYSWLKAQPITVQDDVLGKTRGIVFRDGGLTPEEFKKLSVDELFRPLTLAEMAERDSEAFKRAGVVLP